MSVNVSTSTPVDPRVTRSRRAVLDAVVAELGEVGYGAMTIESVARRAGVGKATIYRHWDGKIDLVESTLEELRDDDPLESDGTPREQVIVMIRQLAAMMAHSRLSVCLPALVSAAQHDDIVREFHQRFAGERRSQLVALIEQAQLAGEVARDADSQMLAESLAGAIFYRRLMTHEPFPPERVDELVNTILPRP